MEYWQVTMKRAQSTYAAWKHYIPSAKVGLQGVTEMDGFIGRFEPLAQERAMLQDDFDEANRSIQRTLLTLRVLGTKVPQIIVALFDENPVLMKEVEELYAVSPRTEGTILQRGRALYPLWERANGLLAAMTPAQAPITRAVGGTVYTVAAFKGLLESYTDLIQALSVRREALQTTHAAMRELDRTVDQLNKRWYKLTKASFDKDANIFDALKEIRTKRRNGRVQADKG